MINITFYPHQHEILYNFVYKQIKFVVALYKININILISLIVKLHEDDTILF